MRLLIVIVNYRTPDLAIDCLSSLAGQIEPGMRAVIVENCSGDDSFQRIEAAIRQKCWHPWAKLVAAPSNAGFSAGNNAGIAPALSSDDPPDYLLLLNPDTIVRDGALRELMSFMQGHPDVGIAGSRLEDPDGTPQRSAFRFPSLAGEFERGMRLGIVSRLLSRWIVAPPVPKNQSQTDWVSGACIILRKKVLDDIGLMDEKYFMYFEETDLCLRARRAGWPCWYVPESRVVHLVGSSTRTGNEPARPMPAWWLDSRRRYFVKNHGIVYAALADVIFAVGYATWRVRRAIQRKADSDPPKVLRDFLRHSVLIRGAS